MDLRLVFYNFFPIIFLSVFVVNVDIYSGYPTDFDPFYLVRYRLFIYFIFLYFKHLLLIHYCRRTVSSAYGSA